MVKIVNDDDDDDDDDDDEDCCSEGKSLDNNYSLCMIIKVISPITKVLPYSITVILYIRVPLNSVNYGYNVGAHLYTYLDRNYNSE